MRKFVSPTRVYLYAESAACYKSKVGAATSAGNLNELPDLDNIDRDGAATQGFVQKEVSAEPSGGANVHSSGRQGIQLPESPHGRSVQQRANQSRSLGRNDVPGDSALQKIIERIRSKIETDPNNPRYLIAKKRQGFMLQLDPLL